MELIPHEELKPQTSFHAAPMIDFLFLMLTIFATLAISRASLYDSEISLAEIKTTPEDAPIRESEKIHHINLSIDKTGAYKWMTEVNQHAMQNTQEIKDELTRQYTNGILASDKEKTEVLLHIDKEAPWKAISDLIFTVRETGFAALPVFEADES